MKTELTRETIQDAINKGAKSISQIYKMLGGSGNISGSTAKKIRELMPDIAERLAANKNANKAPKPAADKPGVPVKASNPATPVTNAPLSQKPPKPATEKPIANKAAVNPAKPTTPKKQAKPPKPPKPAKAPYSKYPRHPQNPYRPGSSYGTAFDILAIKKAGISRDELTNLLSKENGKPVKNAGFDLSVVLSPKESPTGPRHKSAKDGYYVEKEYHHFKLVLP